MLYLDSSALVKHYNAEAGTEDLNRKLEEVSGTPWAIFTSVLTYAEVHAVFARRVREKLLSIDEGQRVQDRFDLDWGFEVTPVELQPIISNFIRDIVREFPLRGADAVHLASALWLRDLERLNRESGDIDEEILFISADQQLLKAASRRHLSIFNPETI